MPEFTADLAVAYGSTLVCATVPIIIGSYVSGKQKATETMSSSDAYMFPIFASCGLFGLFLAFMYLPREYINLVLTVYFLVFGVGALTSSFSPLFSKILKKTEKDEKHVDLKVPFTSIEIVSFDFTSATILSFILSAAISIWYAVTKSWIANNIIGFSFCIQGVALISPGRYHIGCILLGLLLVYDIFWVFGTDVMITVATQFEGPIKLLFPKNFFSGEEWKFSLLGLGDIVLPGLFISFLYRFDKSRGKTPLIYYATVISYFLGLLTTVVVMHVYEHGQPALLYLVPFCVLTSFLAALATGSLNELIAYSEEEEKEDEKEGEKEGEKGEEAKKND